MKIGDYVAWRWAHGLAQGTIVEIHPSRTEITSKGKRIIRNGSPENPALIITHKSGNPVLKLQSEVQILT